MVIDLSQMIFYFRFLLHKVLPFIGHKTTLFKLQGVFPRSNVNVYLVRVTVFIPVYINFTMLPLKSYCVATDSTDILGHKGSQREILFNDHKLFHPN